MQPAERQQEWHRALAQALYLLEKRQPFDESEHPRDEHGRWTDAGNAAIDNAKIEAKTKANVAAASALARASGIKPLPGSKGEHPATIASRNPTAKGAKIAYGQPDTASMKLDPKRYEHDIGLFKNDDFYPNFRPADFSGSTDEATDTIVAQMKDNLKFLYQYGDKHTQVWYDGARALVDDRVKLYGFNDASVAAVYAALSPTKDWDQNVHIADMLMQTYKNQQNTVWSDEMDEKSKTLWSAKNQKVVDLVRGKTLGELTTPAEKALWIRTYDETHNDPSYRTVLPSGAMGKVARNKDGTPSKVIWQSLPSITNAIKALEANGDREIISAAMGTAHKVRSFYNNILDPHSANGDVTVDTHAVGAALMRQLSSSTVAVAHNFGNTPMKVDQPEGWEAAGSSIKTGLSGLYPVYAQAYREAAEELGIQPRQLQSAVWVVKRNTIGNASKITQDAVEAAWRDYHDNPKVTLADTQRAIAKLIGLEKNERHYRIDEEGQRPGDARELHRDGVGPAAAVMDGGAGNGAAGRAAGLVAVRTAQRRAGAEELRAYDESEHPRDEHGRWTDAGGAVAPDAAPPSTATGMSAAEIRTTINKVAKDLDFPAKRIHTHEGHYAFELNGKNYLAAGVAYTSKDVDAPYDIFSEKLITLYNKQLTPENIAGVITHEIEHIKFETAWNRYEADYNKLLDEPGRYSEPSPVVNPDGSLKPPYDAMYPAYTLMHAAYWGTDGIKAFAVSDGVSEYSYDWWKNWQAKKGDVEAWVKAGKSAVHETLAEMARAKYETGKFPEHMGERILSWRGEDTPKPSQAQMDKNAKLWRDLYRAVDKVWKLK